MILSPISDLSRYECLNPHFAQAFDFIRSTNLESLNPGAITLIDDELVVMVNHIPMKSPEVARMEVHNKYIDIHVPFSCAESYTWRNRATLEQAMTPFNDEKDAQKFTDTPSTNFCIIPGEIVIFFPEDAHAACIGDGDIRKLVIKVKVA